MPEPGVVGFCRGVSWNWSGFGVCTHICYRRVLENAGFWTLVNVNLGASPVDRGIVLIQPVRCQNDVVIPNICDVKLYTLLVVGLAVSAIDVNTLDGVVLHPTHDILGAIDITNRKWGGYRYEGKIVKVGKASINNDSFSAAVNQGVCNNFSASNFVNEFKF